MLVLQVSSVAFDTDGLTMGVGTSSAHCLTFDLRSAKPTFVKEHQYGLPITSVKFHQVCDKRDKERDKGGGVQYWTHKQSRQELGRTRHGGRRSPRCLVCRSC